MASQLGVPMPPVLDALAAFFAEYPAPAYRLAYSGGLDSQVLLHASAQLRQQHPALKRLKLIAIHIDHGLQAESAAWATHCKTVCAALYIPLQVVELQLQIPTGESLEATARTARYQAFATAVQSGEYLLTAHHQDDQAETLLLNLLRGAGADGLAAMPVMRAFHAGRLARPLLAVSRAELAAYAAHYSLNYIDDPSNANLAFDRNYLRHEILPRLQARWPAASATLARAAGWQAEGRQLTRQLLATKLLAVQGEQTNTLSVAALLQQDAILQKALIRQWLQQLQLPMPSAKKLAHVLNDVLRARIDALPCVRWAGCEIRRYRDEVYALLPLSAHDPKPVRVWTDLQQPLALPALQQALDPQVLGDLLPLLQASALPVTVRFRQGGERIQRQGGYTLELKQVLQAAGIPPWQRDRIPLVYWGERLVVVVGVLQLTPAQVS